MVGIEVEGEKMVIDEGDLVLVYDLDTKGKILVEIKSIDSAEKTFVCFNDYTWEFSDIRLEEDKALEEDNLSSNEPSVRDVPNRVYPKRANRKVKAQQLRSRRREEGVMITKEQVESKELPLDSYTILARMHNFLIWREGEIGFGTKTRKEVLDNIIQEACKIQSGKKTSMEELAELLISLLSKYV